jgi:hypothetical protein
MTTSEQIGELAAALAKAQGEMDGAKKGSVNPFFRSKFADLASVKDAVREPFALHGLSYVQFPRTEYQGTPEVVETVAKTSGEKRAGVRVICIVSVVTRLMHTSGQWIEGDPVSAMLPNGDPQAVGSAITYLRRYALQAVAGVASEDDDGEAAHRPVKAVGSFPQQVPPAGYDAWLSVFEAVAANGLDELRAAFKESKPEFRDYLTHSQPQRLEAIKTAAKNKQRVSA